MRIRTAEPEDWQAIWPFFERTVAEGETYAYPEGLGSGEAAKLWMERPPGRTLVAVQDDVVLGSAKMGPNRPGRGAHVATASFMVDPAHRRKGVGRALGERVLELARADGYQAMQFNAVVAVNTGAVKLWQELGFEIIGTVPQAFDHSKQGKVGLHVMHRKL